MVLTPKIIDDNIIIISDNTVNKSSILTQTRPDQPQTQTQTETQTSKELAKVGNNKEETLQTPTAAENKIPTAQSPPPAPKKRRRVGLKCVRKLEFMGQRSTLIPDEQATSKLFSSDFDHNNNNNNNNSVKICKRSTSLAFDRINSSNVVVAISTQIV